LGFSEPTDWYRVTQNDLLEGGCASLLNHFYEGSPSAAAMDLYPDYQFLEWFAYSGERGPFFR